MVLEEKEIKFNLKLSTWFVIIFLVLVFLLEARNVDISKLVLALSMALLISPLGILIAISTSSSLRKNLKILKSQEIKDINNKISALEKDKVRTKRTKKLIEMDEDILLLRIDLLKIQKNSFKRRFALSTLFFVLSIVSDYLILGSYLGIKNYILTLLLFLIGAYNLSSMINDLFLVLDRDKI